MIHVLTIHWQSDKWIDIQLDYLEKHLNEPFRVYAFLNDVPNANYHQSKFFYSSQENITSHPIKLNLLADMACFASENEEDFLIFLDGDAFPIDSITSFKNKVFNKYPIAAIQRIENDGDMQPHPCFCMLQIKTWKQIEGDWNPGNFTWKDKFNKNISDVGGIMLQLLEEHNINWYKLHKTNEHDLHPVLFSIYDHLIYHHGAGFRSAGMRTDKNQVHDFENRLKKFRRAKKFLPKALAKKVFRPLKNQVKKNEINSLKIYNKIKSDPDFFKHFNS